MIASSYDACCLNSARVHENEFNMLELQARAVQASRKCVPSHGEALYWNLMCAFGFRVYGVSCAQ